MTTPTTIRRPGISAWSVLAMLLSFGFCPLVTVLAIPVGVLGLRDVRRTGRLGRTPAWIGIVLGCVVTPLTTWGMLWWNDVVRGPMLHGPLDAIVAGQHGDLKTFMQSFDALTDPPLRGGSADRFLHDLGNRWGLLLDITQDTSREALYSDDGWAVRIPYLFRFEAVTVPGEAEFILVRRTDTTSELIHRFAWVLIGTGMKDEAALGWPPGASGLEREPLPEQITEPTSPPQGDEDST